MLIAHLDEQLKVHQDLVDRLPTRTVRFDEDEIECSVTAAPKLKPRLPARGERKATVVSSWASAIQRIEIGERQMLDIMKPGAQYSAKFLATLAGINERFFYTHVKRMVKRGQLVRSGRRHHFLYRKNRSSGQIRGAGFTSAVEK